MNMRLESGPLRGWEGPRTNTKSRAHNIDGGKGSGGTPPENFTFSEVCSGHFCGSFLCMHCRLRLVVSDQKV